MHTIASPHQGTWLGELAYSRNGQQMRPASTWLQQLSQSETPARRGRMTCWYSNCDNIVIPADSAMLAGADNRFVAGAAHVQLAFQPQVMATALGKLDDEEDPTMIGTSQQWRSS